MTKGKGRGCKIFIILLALLFVAGLAQAKDFKIKPTVTSWNGLDSSGTAEKSFPVTFNLYEVGNTTPVSTVQANGPVTGLVMPTYIKSVPNNTSVAVKFYVTVTDSASPTPLTSPKSPDSNELTLVGDDTNPPAGVNEVNVNITP